MDCDGKELAKKKELAIHCRFEYSLLDNVSQDCLTQQISQEISEAGREHGVDYYVLFLLKYFPGAINRPFSISCDKFSVRPDVGTVNGPYKKQMAGAVAYLEQEASILSAVSSTDEKLQQHFKELGILFPRAFGQGVGSLVGTIHSIKRDSPKSSDKQTTINTIELVRKRLAGEQDDYKKRYQQGHENFGDTEESDKYLEWQESLDRIKGFERGILLLNELLQYQW